MAASQSLVNRLLAKLSDIQTLIQSETDWNAKLPQLRRETAALQHLLSPTEGVNTPLLRLQSMQAEINELKRTIDNFPDPLVKEKALRIVDYITTMTGQLFVGPSQEGQTPYMHASYSPLNLTSMLRDVSPFLQATLEIANRPYLDLHNIIQQQSTKLDAVLAALTASTAAHESQVALLQAQVDAAKERADKAECMNAVYDFISACERLLCRRFEIEPVTISRALSTEAIDWGNLRAELDIGDLNKERLVGAINKVKNERLEYGHTSKAVAEKLVLSTSLIAIAEEHFTLSKGQIGVLEKMLAWALPQLSDSDSATLLELRQTAE